MSEIQAEEILHSIREAIIQYRDDYAKAKEKYGATPVWNDLIGMVSALDFALTNGGDMPASWTKTKVIVQGGYSAHCAHCGGNADPSESRHYHGGPKSMWDKDSALDQINGCGAIFETVVNVEILPG